jgi:hypothetical protein
LGLASFIAWPPICSAHSSSRRGATPPSVTARARGARAAPGGPLMTKRRGTAAKSRAKKKVIAPEEEASIRLDALFEEAEKFCVAVGLHQNLMHKIYDAENDWTFILKIDALLETATKEIIKSGLKMKILNRFVGAEELREFVDSLPMNGKTSNC